MIPENNAPLSAPYCFAGDCIKLLRQVRTLEDERDKYKAMAEALRADKAELVATLNNIVAAWDALYAKTKFTDQNGEELENLEFRQMQDARAAIAKHGAQS